MGGERCTLALSSSPRWRVARRGAARGSSARLWRQGARAARRPSGARAGVGAGFVLAGGEQGLWRVEPDTRRSDRDARRLDRVRQLRRRACRRGERLRSRPGHAGRPPSGGARRRGDRAGGVARGTALRRRRSTRQTVLVLDASGSLREEALPAPGRRVMSASGLLFADTRDGLCRRDVDGWRIVRPRVGALPPDRRTSRPSPASTGASSRGCSTAVSSPPTCGRGPRVARAAGHGRLGRQCAPRGGGRALDREPARRGALRRERAPADRGSGRRVLARRDTRRHHDRLRRRRPAAGARAAVRLPRSAREPGDGPRRIRSPLRGHAFRPGCDRGPPRRLARHGGRG